MDDHGFFPGEFDDPLEDDDPVKDDYYAFFNLRKEATDDEINNAYRRLSRMYHPDKHSDPEKKKKAEALFNKTKNIYEILRDPHKRAIYDTLGIKGLEVDGWELVERGKTPQQIREEYERLAWLEEERRLQQQTNPRGAMVLNVNATDLFSVYPYDVSDDYEEEGFFPNIEVSGMSFSQSIEAPMTSKNTACLSGHLSTSNGVGSGSMNCALRRLTSSKGWTEFDIGFGNGLMCSAKGFRTLSKRSYATLTGDMHFTSRGASPGLAMNLAYQLDENIQGILTWKFGRQSGMTTTILRNTNFTHSAASFHLGLMSVFGSLSCTWKFQEKELKLKAGVKAGTFGYLVEGSAEKKISNYTNIGMTMMVGVPMGVSVRVRLARSSQTYMCNVALCEDIMPAPIVYGLLVPLLGYGVLKALIIDPYRKEQEAMDTKRKKEAFASRLSEKKREAEAAVDLMSETYQRNKVNEEIRNGLVLIRALYGKKDPHSDSLSSMEGDSIEVTIPLQCHVKESKLLVYESSKSQLPGFYDPCLGEEKVVQIEYMFKGKLHRVTVKDRDPIRIPKQCHCVEPT